MEHEEYESALEEKPLEFLVSIANSGGSCDGQAIVPVGDGGFAHQPVYVRKPFDRAPDPDACSTNFVLDRLMSAVELRLKAV